MKNLSLILFMASSICYGQINNKLSTIDKNVKQRIIRSNYNSYNKVFDSKENMVYSTIKSWNYSTDASSGNLHDVRKSIIYALALLDSNQVSNLETANNIILKVISLQDTIQGSKTIGIWPYYLEEPLKSKKSAIDFNWADFISVSLIDIYLSYKKALPTSTLLKIKNSLILAANSIQKRNVAPDYTNISIMGTYVTHIVSQLFKLETMQKYASNRFNNFYEYTCKQGFSEYNSPAYTPIALDILFKLYSNTSDKSLKIKTQALYNYGWSIVAHHFHKPTGQWSGPHSRSYNTLLNGQTKAIINQATNYRVDITGASLSDDPRIKHVIPDSLLDYFLSPVYPKVENNTFIKADRDILGYTYHTNKYSLSTASLSSLWIQRRPFLLYWGNQSKPKYLQLRFLHDNYDFSSAALFCSQEKNEVIGGLSLVNNGGDKHISLDKIKGNSFSAKDLRVRLELGNLEDALIIDTTAKDILKLKIDSMKICFKLINYNFYKSKLKWEISEDKTKNLKWIDIIIYSGDVRTFSLDNNTNTYLSFYFSIDEEFSNNLNVKTEEKNININYKNIHLTYPRVPFSVDKF